MICIYNIDKAKIWDGIVKSFLHFDVYYLSGYVKAFQIHGDGEPHLLYYESEGLKAIYVYMKRKTAIDGYFDSVSPYGYGGVLFEGNTSLDNLQIFWNEYVEKMEEQGIVDNFVRYHPILGNAEIMKHIAKVTDLGKTVSFDLSSPDIIWNNISSKTRNMIRKAEKNQIEIHHGKDFSFFEAFQRIYNTTMLNDHADNYYFFDDDYYKSIYKNLYDHYEMFYAVLSGEIIAASIILYANEQMHYHLSGSMIEYRNLAPNNLLLYRAALWGYEQGFKSFHMGGGIGSIEDNLYKFKAGFNRFSNCQFSIGKEIFDQDKYDELVRKRKTIDSNFDESSPFFPLYRA